MRAFLGWTLITLSLAAVPCFFFWAVWAKAA